MKRAFTLLLAALMILPTAMIMRLRVNQARQHAAGYLKSLTNNDLQ